MGLEGNRGENPERSRTSREAPREQYEPIARGSVARPEAGFQESAVRETRIEAPIAKRLEHPEVMQPPAPITVSENSIVDFARSGFESLAWEAAVEVAETLVPMGRPVVRTIYLAKQSVIVAQGLASGRGFYIKVNVPGLMRPQAELLPPGFEVITRFRVFDRSRAISEPTVKVELQIFKPWFDNVDVTRVPDRTPGSTSRVVRFPGQTIYERADDNLSDPWRVWLNVIGDALITNLSEALATASGALAGDVRAALTAGRAAGSGSFLLYPST